MSVQIQSWGFKPQRLQGFFVFLCRSLFGLSIQTVIGIGLISRKQLMPLFLTGVRELKIRCKWAVDPLNSKYHDQEWGRPVRKDLKKRGFRFVGSTICYAFMQACGLVNDHSTDCFRYPTSAKAVSSKASLK